MSLPSSGVVYVDAQVIIYTVEQHVLFGRRLAPLWLAADDGRVSIIASELTVMETAIIPLRRGDAQALESHSRFLAKPSVDVVPISRAILLRAAGLRAQMQTLRTPDAIHLATSLDADCDVFLTNDFKLRQIAAVKALIVSDLPDPSP